MSHEMVYDSAVKSTPNANAYSTGWDQPEGFQKEVVYSPGLLYN